VARLEEKENEQFRDLEEEVFKTLDNQKRREILRYIGEKNGTSFTDIMKSTGVADSPSLSYHIRALSPFLKQENGKYNLSPIGKDAYNLLLKITSYNKLELLRRRKYEVTLGNTVLWISAIAASVYLGADVFLYSVTLPILATVSLSLTYALFE
jgi:DNA-binding transcriptional ArsR family regulator